MGRAWANIPWLQPAQNAGMLWRAGEGDIVKQDRTSPEGGDLRPRTALGSVMVVVALSLTS